MNAQPPDAAELLAEFRRGNRAAFGQLYEMYSRMVHGILLARVPYGHVDDLVHDVFLSAMRNLNGLRDPGSFGAWLAVIARNRARDYHRARHPEADLPAQRPGRAAAANAEAMAALEIIRAMPDAYRETLILRLVEGMTGDEIAARTGMTPGSVRVNLHRGMKMLRERLEAPARGGR